MPELCLAGSQRSMSEGCSRLGVPNLYPYTCVYFCIRVYNICIHVYVYIYLSCICIYICVYSVPLPAVYLFCGLKEASLRYSAE